jgi:hypothetical protein
MLQLPHAKARHMSIIHVLVYFSKLKNRRKTIKRERVERLTQAEKHVKRERKRDRVSVMTDLLFARKLCQEILTKGDNVDERLLVADTACIILYYTISYINIGGDS